MSERLNHNGSKITVHVPDELAFIRADLLRFFHAMVYKLHRNRHKGRWSDITLDRGLPKLHAEVAELEEAIKNGNSIEIIMEAADIGNWALILANVALEEKHHEATGRDGAQEAQEALRTEGQGPRPAGHRGEGPVDGGGEERCSAQGISPNARRLIRNRDGDGPNYEGHNRMPNWRD